MNIEKIMKQMQANQHKLSDNGYKEPEFEKTCKKAFMIAEENDHE